jgi:hypothetical protein
MTGLTIGITIFLVLLLGVVVAGFLSDERRATKRTDFLRISGRERIECQICRHVYEGVPVDGLTKCPVCGSFNQESGKGEAGKDEEEDSER